MVLEKKVQKKSTKKTSERGQLAVEAMMIVLLLIGLSLYASREIRRRNLMGKIVSGPWQQISGMMATGNWQRTEQAMENHQHPHVNTMTRVGD